MLLLTLAIVGAVIALGLIGTSAWRTYRTLAAASMERQRAYEFLMALRLLRQHVGEARVGVTGYAITRDSAYRGTYLSGTRGLESDTTALRSFAAGAPTLSAPLDALGPALVAYDAALARVAARVDQRSSSNLATELRSGRDFVLLEDVRRSFIALEKEQKRLMTVGASVDTSKPATRGHLKTGHHG